MADDWYERWRGLKERRITAATSIVAWLALWVIFGAGGLLVGFLLAFGAYIRLRAFPCPRCGVPMVGARLKSFPDRCQGCGLRTFGHELDVSDFERSPDVFTMSRRVRRLIAGYEIASGATLMLMSAFAHAPLWGEIMLEGLAAFSLAGGWWLWRDDLRGYQLSRAMQLIQLIRIQSHLLVYVATAGIALDMQTIAGNFSVNAAFNTELTLRWNAQLPFGVGINLWATAIFLLLLRAKPAPRKPVGGSATPNAPLTTAPDTDGTVPPVVGA